MSKVFETSPQSIYLTSRKNDDIGEFTEKPEPTPWWRCCCPHKMKGGPNFVTKKRRRSVALAEQSLQEASEAMSDEAFFIEPKYMPLTFVPDFIIGEIFDDSLKSIPYVISSNAVLLVADVCGFTSLCESYCQKGVSGIEELASVLNGFMSTLTGMLIHGGGDILNFAGDAFLVQWLEETNEGMETAVKKAYECAVALQTHQCLQTKNLGGTLKIKIGIALGPISTWVLGSLSEFLLFVVAGHTLPGVQKAEGLCAAGEITVSKEVFDVLKKIDANTYDTTELEEGYVKITGYDSPQDETEPIPNRIDLFKKCNPECIAMTKIFLIPALRGIKSADELEYVSELTMVTILFIALLNVEVAEPKVLDSTFDIILASVKQFGGALNKMLLFDKGCTFLVAFGLPGLKHSNDAARGISCGKDIVDRLGEIEVQVSVGISSGTCYCGMVGHPQRQEYTVIGSDVNMAARIMVVYNDEPIALNVDTYHLSRDELGYNSFVELPARKLKGIDSVGTIYAYRKLSTGKTYSISTFDIVEDSNLHGSEKEKERIRRCIAAMCDEKRRSAMKEKTLLPVLIIQGQNSSGKSYTLFIAVDAAVGLNYKAVVCCAIPSYCLEPFTVISKLIQRMLGITMNEGCFDRERMIMTPLPSSNYHNLYLLNHLFDVNFPVPKDVNPDVKFCKNDYCIIAVDNADFIDDQSWYLIHELAEEEKVSIVLTLTQGFKEVNTSASALLLKAFTHVNMESHAEDYFAPLLCWYLGVKAVHTQIFVYLKEITGGKAHLLKEISLSPITFQYIQIIPLESLHEERIKKEFYVDHLKVLHHVQPLACDLKPGVDLRLANVPTNINDAVKQCINNLTIQDRLLLKRAAVLGGDFDLHMLEAISSGVRREEVLESINNLLANNIFSSVCTLENMVLTSSKLSCVVLEYRNICFCFSVHLRLKAIQASQWPIGPYHRLKFRTHQFRSGILAYMTKDQLYGMRMEVADNLETNGPECVACKTKRTKGMELKQTASTQELRRYSIDTKKCVCLQKRPKLYSEISVLYSSIGMQYLPTYFKKKAAQAANNTNHPIQALNYLHHAQEMIPKGLLSAEETFEAESYFDPLILEISLKKTKAESFLLLRDTYSAASHAFQGIEMLGMDAVCFHGVFNPREFKKILPRFPLLHAEYVTKLIGVISKTYLQVHYYKLAQDMMRVEYIALKLYPIDFLQVLNHMASLYQCKYWIHQTEKLTELENNIFKLCHEKLRNFDVLMDLTEIKGVGYAYASIIEINLSLAKFGRSENTANEGIKILHLVNELTVLPKIRVLLFHVHYHTQNYDRCITGLKEINASLPATESRRFRALYICCLMLTLMKRQDGVDNRQLQIDKCNAFASEWKRLFEVVPSYLALYISACASTWCLYSDENTCWIAGKSVFKECYGIALQLNEELRKERDNYWVISAVVMIMEIKMRILKEGLDGCTEDAASFREEMGELKHKIKSNYPLYWITYKELMAEVEKVE